MYSQAGLEADGAPALRGRLTGTCAGRVYVEVGSTNQARPLSSTWAELGVYVLRVPAAVPVRVRWGCDPDGDGIVAADALAEATLGQLSRDLPLDLYVPDPAVSGRHTLTVASTRAAPLLPANGALAAPGAGLPPPDAPAPADAAVGPPLPQGPPPDAGPPPPTGSAPPPAQ